MQVRVDKCEREIFAISPINPGKKWAYYKNDLQEEINTLVTNLEKIDLKSNSNYVVDYGPNPKTIEEFHIQFMGASQVINALYLMVNNIDNFKIAHPGSDKELRKSLRNFALQITEDECNHAYIKEKIQNDLLTILIAHIEIVHKKIKECPSAVNQLIKDLEAIKKHTNDTWGKCNFYLAYAALYKARAMIENEKKFQKMGVMFFDKDNISEKYHKILCMFDDYIISFPDYNPNCKEKQKFEFLESNYYKEISELHESGSVKNKANKRKLS